METLTCFVWENRFNTTCFQRLIAEILHTMKTIFSIAVVGIFCISGCATPGSRYADAHPELSPEHRRVLVTGRISAGDEVQGLTKEQITFAMGRPKKIEKHDDQEAWIYTKGKGFPFVPDSQFTPDYDQLNLGDLGDCPMIEEKTTVFFKGNQATFAQITQEKP